LVPIRRDVASPRRAGRPEHRLGPPLFDDRAALHHDDVIGHVAGEGELVRHDHHRHAGARQVSHQLQHLAHHFRIEGRGRLVEQDKLRLHRQRPGDCDALLLTAGQGAGIGLGKAAEADASEQFEGPALGDLPVLMQHVPRAERDVLQRRQMREQLEMLEHHADPAAIGAERDACPARPAADEFAPEVLLFDCQKRRRI
jgi:hypothetical protein